MSWNVGEVDVRLCSAKNVGRALPSAAVPTQSQRHGLAEAETSGRQTFFKDPRCRFYSSGLKGGARTAEAFADWAFDVFFS